jgi:hypothetical protein
VSKVFKSIGKIFKKVVKTVVKIAPFALAAAAVVFTGGAALGILPTFSAAVGGLVSSLGLSAGVAGALTGAVTSAGFGAALGFVTGGKKGLQKGALMGALTGGVLGAVNPATFGIVKGADGAVTTASKLAAASKGIMPVSSSLTNAPAIAPSTTLPDALKSLPDMVNPGLSQATGAVTSNVAAAGTGIAPMSVSSSLANPVPASTMPDFTTHMATGTSQALAGIGDIQSTVGGVGGIPASGGGNGILDFITKNPTLVGSVLSAIGAGGSKISSKDLQKQVDAEVQLRQRLGQVAYGGAYSGKADPFGIGGQNYAIPQPRYYYDKGSNTVVDRQAQGA